MIAIRLIQHAPPQTHLRINRQRLLLAWTYDVATLVLTLAASSLAATVWMLARTNWGLFDLGTGDAVFALALCISAAPAWTAWQWLQLWGDGATFGTRRAGITEGVGGLVQGGRLSEGRLRSTAWLGLHPASLPCWAWMAGALFATATPMFIVIAVVPLAASLLVAFLSVLSMVMLLARPSLRPLHVWLARASFGGRR